MSLHVLTPENYDGVSSALIGNGELCTTVGPTGFHTPPEEQTDIAHKTQHFVLAGRRKAGPQHSLVNFGYVLRRLYIDAYRSEPAQWQQTLDPTLRIVDSRIYHNAGPASMKPCLADEHSVAQVLIDVNLFETVTEVWNPDIESHDYLFEVEYRFGELDADIEIERRDSGLEIRFQVAHHLGSAHFVSIANTGRSESLFDMTEVGAIFRHSVRLENAGVLDLKTWVQFTDRLNYQFPVVWTPSEIDIATDHSYRTSELFQASSDTVTGEGIVDQFRLMSLYTLRCQATPWSIPPTVSEPYWGAGTFHDEMYPFLGLLSSNHTGLAERVPYYRLSTLPQAMQRARGKGALYPWSSTEYGEERDPNGLWLTERFHLGQFAVCIWMLWLYNRDRVQLDDLYPVLKEIARYFELNMLERDARGMLGTKSCVDFDESVGVVKNGPFTICAAIASLEYAANAAEILGKDPERIPRWRTVAGELRQNPLTIDDGRWTIPDGQPLHYSVLGPIFPFRIDVNSQVALATAAHIHETCRSTTGWKPGFSEVFEGSNWMWTAAHLGIVHALQGNGDLAWEAIKAAPESAGPFLSPNEHVDKDGVIHVPWFTTGCGGWLYALNCLFVQVDEEGAKLLPAVPSALPDAKFRDLRADYGVRVSGEFRDGKLISLSARAPEPILWRFRTPTKYIQQNKPAGRIVKMDTQWLEIEMDEIGRESTSLLDFSDPATH